MVTSGPPNPGNEQSMLSSVGDLVDAVWRVMKSCLVSSSLRSKTEVEVAYRPAVVRASAGAEK